MQLDIMAAQKQFIESNFNLILIRKYVICINKNLNYVSLNKNDQFTKTSITKT